MSNLNYNEKGLIPVIIQDVDNGEVLMLGYMNEESLRLTRETGEAWFYSRSRQELWHKGETSGNIIKVVEIRKDCEDNSLLVKGRPTGPVCHTGNKNCYFRRLEED
jgi:phosphoribosyl-ATP pyrophosphohydrolase/phosphoribosyl-AMP cyclohydrolase